MKEYILEVHSLSFTYPDGTRALRDVNMKIKPGEITAILGGNGAGKSTLFHTLNGILKPSKGQIVFEGKPIDYSRKGLIELRKSIGIVFQDPDNQLFSASVYQDVSFGLMNLKLPEEEVRRRVNEAINRTGIVNIKDKPTHSLSFGQKKRVAIAGVLAMEPKVLILDEPTAGLDPKGVSEIMTFLKEIQQELAVSIIISTHDIDMVPIYCDKVFVMNEGEIVAHGTPEEIFQDIDRIRSVNLRLPRIGHLMEILKEKDGFHIDSLPLTISKARRALIRNRLKDIFKIKTLKDNRYQQK
ncbi:MAG: ATP-binding cassette domain-containing protein [Clostridiales bacterium]|nr:ATP-binding cassette domain-containing protein [Clostridiales bacterium]